jgi:hypothetical protein
MLSAERPGMNLIESLALLGASVALFLFARGRNGDALQIFQKLPWGLMGVAANLNWLH